MVPAVQAALEAGLAEVAWIRAPVVNVMFPVVSILTRVVPALPGFPSAELLLRMERVPTWSYHALINQLRCRPDAPEG